MPPMTNREKSAEAEAVQATQAVQAALDRRDGGGDSG